MNENTGRRVWASITAGLLTGTAYLMGAVTQMLNDGKTNFSDIAELVWLVAVLATIAGAAKDVQSRMNEHKHTGGSNEFEAD